jgi:N-acetylneuraminate synthase
MSEVFEAVQAIQEEGCKDLTLLHCVLSYPTKNEDANLNVIKTLKRTFPDLKIGYSDHTLPDETMTILTTAYLYGAEVIEKHFTLDKTLKGNDHYHAGDPSDFRKAVNNFNLIKTISGSDKKDVFACEQVPRKEARRSIIIIRDMKKGEIITANDIMYKRPGKGISPKFVDVVLGRELKTDCAEDTVLTWQMI